VLGCCYLRAARYVCPAFLLIDRTDSDTPTTDVTTPGRGATYDIDNAIVRWNCDSHEYGVKFRLLGMLRAC
jgi:hypothetical protein